MNFDSPNELRELEKIAKKSKDISAMEFATFIEDSLEDCNERIKLGFKHAASNKELLLRIAQHFLREK